MKTLGEGGAGAGGCCLFSTVVLSEEILETCRYKKGSGRGKRFGREYRILFFGNRLNDLVYQLLTI